MPNPVTAAEREQWRALAERSELDGITAAEVWALVRAVPRLLDLVDQLERRERGVTGPEGRDMSRLIKTAHIPRLTALSWEQILGRGTVCTVESPEDFERDKPPMLHTVVNIDGHYYTVLGVESHTLPRIAKGTPIGLLVRRWYA